MSEDSQTKEDAAQAPHEKAAKQGPPRQVTVQPQEPPPALGGPPKQSRHPDQGARPVAPGKKDDRSNPARDGVK